MIPAVFLVCSGRLALPLAFTSREAARGFAEEQGGDLEVREVLVQAQPPLPQRVYTATVRLHPGGVTERLGTREGWGYAHSYPNGVEASEIGTAGARYFVAAGLYRGLVEAETERRAAAWKQRGQNP